MLQSPSLTPEISRTELEAEVKEAIAGIKSLRKARQYELSA
jgi:hypothetical protein